MRTITTIFLSVFLVLATFSAVGQTESSPISVIVKSPVVKISSEKSMAQFDKELRRLNISNEQLYVLLLAKKIGEKYNLGLSLMGVTWQESKAGKFGPIGDIKAGFGRRSYGVCQVKVRTARHMLHLYPELRKYSRDGFSTDEELIVALITNKTFNLDVAVHVLLSLRNQGLTWDEMMEAYNLGHVTKHPSRFKYTREVAHNMHSRPLSVVDKGSI